MPSDAQKSKSTSIADPGAGCVSRRIVRCRQGAVEAEDDWIASEVPIALSYNGEAHVVMLATPMDLEEFALGFSLSEAIIAASDEVETITMQERLEGIEIDLRVAEARAAAVSVRRRNLGGRSSCGLCGMQHLEDVLRMPAKVSSAIRISSDALHRALQALVAAQPLNRLTGATHAAAWVDGDGELKCVREDVGRHNALDKLIGAMAKRGLDSSLGFLVLTSRASYEMVQKAASVGIGLVAAVSAPTALAAQLAENCGVTLIGFARDGGHVVYTHAYRIAGHGA